MTSGWTRDIVRPATARGQWCDTVRSRTDSPGTPASFPASPRHKLDTSLYSSVRPLPNFGNSPCNRINLVAHGLPNRLTYPSSSIYRYSWIHLSRNRRLPVLAFLRPFRASIRSVLASPLHHYSQVARRGGNRFRKTLRP